MTLGKKRTIQEQNRPTVRETQPLTLGHRILGLDPKITHRPSLAFKRPSNLHRTRRLPRLPEYVSTSTVQLNWKTNLHNPMRWIETEEEKGRRNLMPGSRRKWENERQNIMK